MEPTSSTDEAEEGTPHPSHLRWCREGALICIKYARYNIEANLLRTLDDEATRRRIAGMIRTLRDEGVTPASAGRLLDELQGKAPVLRLI
jgi:hypothetical protein